MMIEGYRLSGYDATYKKTMFAVKERNEGVIEIEDAEGGITFILDLKDTDLYNQDGVRKL